MNLILYVEYSNGGKIMNDLVESAKKGDKSFYKFNSDYTI